MGIFDFDKLGRDLKKGLDKLNPLNIPGREIEKTEKKLEDAAKKALIVSVLVLGGLGVAGYFLLRETKRGFNRTVGGQLIHAGTRLGTATGKQLTKEADNLNKFIDNPAKFTKNAPIGKLKRIVDRAGSEGRKEIKKKVNTRVAKILNL